MQIEKNNTKIDLKDLQPCILKRTKKSELTGKYEVKNPSLASVIYHKFLIMNYYKNI